MFKGKLFAVFSFLLLSFCCWIVEIKSVSSGSYGPGILKRHESPKAALEKRIRTRCFLWFGAMKSAHCCAVGLVCGRLKSFWCQRAAQGHLQLEFTLEAIKEISL